MSDQATYKKKVGIVLVLFPLIFVIFIIPSLTDSPAINSVSVQTMEEDFKKTPNEWEKITNIHQPDVGYAHVFNESIYFIGKEAVQVYDPLTDTWKLMKNTGLTGDHTSGGSAILGDCIYFLYGWNNAIFHNISENRFVEFERSSLSRIDFAVAELNGLIYVSGGWLSNDPTSLVLVEVYDPETKIWSETASMNVGRKRHEMIALDGYLYAIGGEIEESFTETTNSVERYNHTTNTWEIMNVPTYSYSNFGITATDNHNFVVIHFTTEVYNASSGKWLRGPNLFPTFRDILHPALTYYNGCVYAIGGQQFIEGNDCFNSVYRWNIRTHKFEVLSRTPSISEFLNIWPRVFPTILLIECVMILSSIFISLLFGILTKFQNTKRMRKYLYVNGWPININSFKGYQKNVGITIVNTAILAGLLMPVISFLPIILYNASFKIIDLYLMGLIPAYFLNTFGISRLHKKLEKPRYYYLNDLLVIQSFGNDLIIPVSAMKKLQMDPDRLWAAIHIKYRFFPISWTTKYFAFDSIAELNTFIEEINVIVPLPWEVSSFSSFVRKILIIPHKNIQNIHRSALETQLNTKTLQVLTFSQPSLNKSFRDPKSSVSTIKEIPSSIQDVKYCINCGQPTNVGSFCIYCGARYPVIHPHDNDQQSSN
ncbi:MAG: Kelch repeat-containing protein [Candidatus Hodarchaeales archaeon]